VGRTSPAPIARASTCGRPSGRDFAARYADLHLAQAGDACPTRGTARRRARHRGREHLQARDEVLDGAGGDVPRRAGQARPIVMGSYGIGPARIVASAIEQRHDADGIVWPWSIAPMQVHVLPVNPKQPAVREMAERLYRDLGAAGVEAILRRPRRAARGEVQGRRPPRHPNPGDGWRAPEPGRQGRGAERDGIARTSRSRRTAWWQPSGTSAGSWPPTSSVSQGPRGSSVLHIGVY
jgi:hypothetical protein